MTLRVYIIRFPQKILRAWTYEMPNGRLEQYQIALLRESSGLCLVREFNHLLFRSVQHYDPNAEPGRTGLTHEKLELHLIHASGFERKGL